jgi:hypothetical protein
VATREEFLSIAEQALREGDDATAMAAMDEAEKLSSAPQEKSMMQSINEAITSNPIGRGVSEFAAGVNRGATGLVDFAASLPNAAMQVAGIDSQIPSLTKAMAPATQGNFMQEGIGRDVVRAAGEVVPSSIAMGAGLRSAAQALPSMGQAAESTGAGVLRQMGSSTLAQDAGYGALSGAGGAAGAALGQKVGGDTGEQVGAMLGSIAAPVAAAGAIQGAKGVIDRSQEASLIKEAAPTIDALKTKAREVYKKIDDTGAVVSSDRFDQLSRELASTMRSSGFNKKIHPKVSAALDEIDLNTGKNQPLSEVDIYRRIARSAAASSEPDEARLGSEMVAKIDEFMDSLKPDDLVGGNSQGVGKMYKEARGLWSRAKKAEDIELIIEKAKNQASGFENGLRRQMASFINNPKNLRGYTKDELAAMQKVVRGGGLENTAKFLGKFGFTEGQATSVLMSSLGVAGGAAVGGSVGAVAVPLVGQVSKNLAQKMTRNNAEMVSRIVRSGKDANSIAKAYFSSVPPRQRAAEDLAELLLKTGAEGKLNIPNADPQIKKIISDSAYIMGAINSQKEEEK